MKEFNINIEGYNVNGICVGCLNYNRRMYNVPMVKECFKLLADIDVSEELEIQVCWECLAYVKKAMLFREQILKAYDFLINYSKVSTYLESPLEFEAHASTRLSKQILLLDSTAINDDDDEKDTEIKEEEAPGLQIEVPIKDEFPDILDDNTFDDLPSPLKDITSDEDVKLSMLIEQNRTKKRKKKKELGTEDISNSSDGKIEKKGRRKKLRKKDIKERDKSTEENVSETNEITKKRAKKLKNLPEDIVDLYTMNEEEMWKIRDEDRQSKEFNNLKYKCDHCIIGFNTNKLQIDHGIGKHIKKSDTCHQCQICQAYFLTKDNLSCHRSLHANSYKCILCGFTTTLKLRMLKHVVVHKDTPAHVCDTCGSEFTTKSKLAYHRSVCRQGKPQCDCCGKVFANKMTLKYHLKILPVYKGDKPKEKLFIPCKGCDKVFHSQKSYRAHVVIHDGLTYPCPICGKLFQWKRNLARHTRNHKEREAGELHECRACGKSFASRDCYNNHMRMSKRHVPEDSYQHECNYCGKKFATKWVLTDHIDWDHLKRIKYQCRVCFKAFKTAKIMVAHVNNIHEGKRKETEGLHLCDICGKSYKTVKRLKGHVWAMHTRRVNTKSFKCKLCPATFTWQTSIYKHMKMMHDSNKKNKTPRAPPPVKKEDTYPGIDLANRMQYFQQNLTNNLNLVHIQPLGLPQNMV